MKYETELLGFVVLELALFGVGFISALLGAWNLFAAIAFMVVLAPLWVIAVCAVIVAGDSIKKMDADNGPQG